jgi:hypothetical protein
MQVSNRGIVILHNFLCGAGYGAFCRRLAYMLVARSNSGVPWCSGCCGKKVEKVLREFLGG